VFEEGLEETAAGRPVAALGEGEEGVCGAVGGGRGERFEDGGEGGEAAGEGGAVVLGSLLEGL